MRANRVSAGAVRGRVERGATLVEYALIVAVVVGASLIAIRFLGTSAASEQAKQSDCIAVRPAPAYCTDDFKVGTSTSTTTGGGNGAEVSTTTTAIVTTTTTTTTPPTTVAPTTTEAPTTSTTTASTYRGNGDWYSYSRRNLEKNQWRASVTPLITDAAGKNVKNATVVIRWQTSRDEGTLECTTGSNGRCTVDIAVSDSRGYVDFTIVTVDGLPLASPPRAQRVLQP